MSSEDEDEKKIHFHDMEIDQRILKAISMLGWVKPTLIQEKAIPLLMEGKDVLLRARTGSGKTAAFAIPVIQKILNTKQVSSGQTVRALILAPTRELCEQIHKNILELTIKCSREVSCVDISKQLEITVQRPLLVAHPDIVVATPTQALAHIRAENLKIKNSLEMLIVDEADLIFSFGYENDIKELFKYLPRMYQASLASATLSEDVLAIKNLILHNPVTLKLNEPELAPASQLCHYLLWAEEDDKATILYALIKLHLIKGKTIIFVNTVDKCYKLKLFLEQFSIRTCVLNSELPANVRCHSVSQFNQGLYNIIIASDELALEKPEGFSKNVPSRGGSKRKKDKESGVSRGIDFQCVSNVLNFDFPLDVNSYIHRAGRTARVDNRGSALSLVSMKEERLVKEVEKQLTPKFSENKLFKMYEFKMEEASGFQYRANDAWRSVTKIAVREARLKEIKQEILNSKSLKGYFADNPHDFDMLRHDKALHTVKVQEHLANVPEYLVPDSLKKLVGMNSSKKRRRIGVRKPNKKTKYGAREESIKKNPLLSLEFSGFKKKKK